MRFVSRQLKKERAAPFLLKLGSGWELAVASSGWPTKAADLVAFAELREEGLGVPLNVLRRYAGARNSGGGMRFT